MDIPWRRDTRGQRCRFLICRQSGRRPHRRRSSVEIGCAAPRYRRVAAATAWFAGGNAAGDLAATPDVFAASKAAGLASAAATLEALAARTRTLLEDPDATPFFLSLALWGNRMDLSLWPADSGVAASSEAFDAVLASSAEQLLADDTDAVAATLSNLRTQGGGVVDLVVDNAGFELCTDLLLAEHLVASGAASAVRFRVKHHPTFVSDALERDVDAHIETLAADASKPAAAELAAKWKARRASGAFVCQAEPRVCRAVSSFDESQRRRGQGRGHFAETSRDSVGTGVLRRRVAATPRPGTWTFRGDESRRRHGRGRGHSAETSRGDAAAR